MRVLITFNVSSQVKGGYVIDKALMKGAKTKMAVLHPLPRVDEISTDLDSDPRYFSCDPVQLFLPLPSSS